MWLASLENWVKSSVINESSLLIQLIKMFLQLIFKKFSIHIKKEFKKSYIKIIWSQKSRQWWLTVKNVFSPFMYKYDTLGWFQRYFWKIILEASETN